MEKRDDLKGQNLWGWEYMGSSPWEGHIGPRLLYLPPVPILTGQRRPGIKVLWVHP